MKRFLLVPLCALTVASSYAAVTSSTSDSISVMPVLMNQPEIRRDLGLSSVQRAKLDFVFAESRAKIGIVSATGLLDPSCAKVSESDLLADHARSNRRVLAALTPSQRVRFRQIERQFHGGLFLLSPSEQENLSLTAEQRRKISELRSYEITKTKAVLEDFKLGRKSALRKDIDLRRIERTTSRSMLHLLTSAQKRQWLDSLGAPLGK